MRGPAGVQVDRQTPKSRRSFEFMPFHQGNHGQVRCYQKEGRRRRCQEEEGTGGWEEGQDQWGWRRWQCQEEEGAQEGRSSTYTWAIAQKFWHVPSSAASRLAFGLLMCSDEPSGASERKQPFLALDVWFYLHAGVAMFAVLRRKHKSRTKPAHIYRRMNENRRPGH